MGVYIRKDSKHYWMRLRGAGCQSTGIPIDSDTAAGRAEQRRDAEDIYRAEMTTRAKARAGLTTIQADAITFTKYAAWFTKHVLPRRRGAVRDRVIVAHLVAWFGARPLQEVTRAAVQEYVSHRLTTRIGKAPASKQRDTRKTVSANTVNREVDVLKGMLRDAVPRHLEANPLAGMKKLRVTPTKKRILSAEDETRLLAVLAPADKALLLVAIDSLLRLSNVVHLRWADVQGDLIVLPDSKTGPYTVPLSDRARAALDLLPKRGAYVFPRRRTKDPRNTIRLMLRSACKRAGLLYGRGIGITFHTATRASGATRMLRAGIDPKTVQEVGHWEDFRAMQSYLQTDDRLKRDAVNRVGRPVADT